MRRCVFSRRLAALVLSGVAACNGTNTQALLDAKFLSFPAPYIDTILVTQYNRIVVTFNEKVVATTGANKDNYAIVETSGAALAVTAAAELNGGSISFQISTGIQLSNREYSITASNIQNLRGSTVTAAQKKFIGYNSTGNGVFVDNGNGTVYSSGLNMTWAKCAQDNSGVATLYNTALNDCSGGTGINGTFAYCPAFNDSCNGGVAGQNLDGGGISPLYSTCAALNSGSGFAGKKLWRVPTFAELSSIIVINSNPSVNATLFPGTASANYWTATSASTSQSWIISFGSGVNNLQIKTTASNARCIYTGS